MMEFHHIQGSLRNPFFSIRQKILLSETIQNMKELEEIVERLRLEPHPEGGFFRETYRSGETFAAAALPDRFSGDRAFSTAIYYLLGPGDFSGFHRIRSDETWHFYKGDGLVVHMLAEGGSYERFVLGADPDRGEVFQATVKAGRWFASEPLQKDGYALVGCTVSPGFDFRDFEMADADTLLAGWPLQGELIGRLCR
jgi:predicted cupin superfamily sugar epimerase